MAATTLLFIRQLTHIHTRTHKKYTHMFQTETNPKIYCHLHTLLMILLHFKGFVSAHIGPMLLLRFDIYLS